MFRFFLRISKFPLKKFDVKKLYQPAPLYSPLYSELLSTNLFEEDSEYKIKVLFTRPVIARVPTYVH